MRTKDIKKGISLIVLIVTIIVVIILAAVVILTLSKNNPIESAKEARFKEDVRTFQDELALYISKQYANAGGHWDGSISAKSYNEIVEYIPSFTKKYEGKFVINSNNLEYTNKLDDKEKGYVQSLNVNKRKSILPDEYQQIEYIESTGTQYINTQYIPKINTELEMDVSFSGEFKASQDGSTTIFRCDSSRNNYCFQLNFGGNPHEGNTLYAWVNKSRSYGGTICSFSIDDNIRSNRNTIKMKSEKILYGTATRNLDKKTSDNNSEVLIFGGIVNEEVITFKAYNMRVYCLKFYEGDELKRDYVPCKNIYTKEIGLYEVNEGKFYTNQGTGEDFIAGPDVNE